MQYCEEQSDAEVSPQTHSALESLSLPVLVCFWQNLFEGMQIWLLRILAPATEKK